MTTVKQQKTDRLHSQKAHDQQTGNVSQPLGPRRLGPRRLSAIVEAHRRFPGQNSKLFGTLLREWRLIVGADLAQVAVPMGLKFNRSPESASGPKRRSAVLTLRIPQSKALDIHYRQTQILGRIEDVFGYRLISRLKVIQCETAVGVADGEIYAVSDPDASDHDMARTYTACLPPGKLKDALVRLAARIHMTERQHSTTLPSQFLHESRQNRS